MRAFSAFLHFIKKNQNKKYLFFRKHRSLDNEQFLLAAHHLSPNFSLSGAPPNFTCTNRGQLFESTSSYKQNNIFDPISTNNFSTKYTPNDFYNTQKGADNYQNYCWQRQQQHTIPTNRCFEHFWYFWYFEHFWCFEHFWIFQ